MKAKNILKTVTGILIALLLMLGIACDEEKNKLPTVAIYFDYEGEVGEGVVQGVTVTVTVNGSDPDGDIIEVQIYLDETLMATKTSSPYSYEWLTAESEPGEHTFKTIVTDNDGATSTVERNCTLNGLKPLTDFSSDKTRILLGAEIQFSDSSTQEPNEWLWDFGDGNTSTEQNPTHAYVSTGVFDVKLTASNEYGSVIQINRNFITILDTTVSDYDGNKYKVVQIGDQMWMAENLKTTHYADGVPMVDGAGVIDLEGNDTTKYYFAYDDDENNVAIYGRLYTWAAVMNDEASSTSNPSGVQGVCPDNWHVPSKAEWEDLVEFLGGEEIAGGMLKAKGYDYWNYPNQAASNESGFTALPGGIRVFTIFKNKGSSVSFSSSSENGNITAIATNIFYNDSKIEIYAYSSKNVGRSIRCIRD